MRKRTLAGLLVSLVALGACTADVEGPGKASEPSPTPRAAETAPASPNPGPSATPTSRPTPSKKDPKGGPDPIVVEYKLVRRVNDAATSSFERVAEATLSDARGWERAEFDLVRRKRTRYRVVLAEGEAVDRLCLPYETYGTYSCQNGPVVALNADRWRTATPKWTGTLAGYRRMLVNHEFGHLLGQHHPEVQCPRVGQEAPIMAQQSTELNGCLPNPWPLAHEIERAERHDLPLAPGFGE